MRSYCRHCDNDYCHHHDDDSPGYNHHRHRDN